MPNEIVINTNRWEHQGAAQTLHVVAALAGTHSCGGLFIRELAATLCFTRLTANRLPPYSSYLRLSAAQINCADVATCTFYLFLFYGKVILAAVNLLSQITLLTLRISYVFSSLSSLNLPLSCPELSVASRVGRKEVLKVDV